MEKIEPLTLPLDAPERRRLPPLLRRAWYGLNQALRRRLVHLRLTPDQFTVMRTMIEAEPRGLTQKELAATISSDPNTIASLLERMEKNGLIERVEDESDRRARRIRLLPQGRKTYRSARNVAIELQAEVLSALEPQQREPFLASLAVIAEACSRAADASGRAAKDPEADGRR